MYSTYGFLIHSSLSFTLDQDYNYILFSFEKNGPQSGYSVDIFVSSIEIVSFEDVMQQSSSLASNSILTIVRDQNGKFSVSISDKSGKNLMTARPGSSDNNSHVLEVRNVIDLHPSYKKYAYFYLLNEQSIQISGSDYYIEDILTDQVVFSSESGTPLPSVWQPGFYRLLLNSGSVTLKYKNYFLDVAYNFYDNAGRLTESISPNGFKQLKSGVSYSQIDKTTYKYNFRGWLLEKTEPDAGTISYKYRRDGKIRFSQNAQQYANDHAPTRKIKEGKFSYTNYDVLLRPIESGEYTGIDYEYATLSTLLTEQEYEFGKQFSGEFDRTSWIETLYDIPDPDLNGVFHLPDEGPEGYVQGFLRGSVSRTRNANNQTWYSYDEFGRVTWMAQKPTLLNRLFVVKYTYDFLGNVRMVGNLSYNLEGQIVTQFYHHYEYDLDHRLHKALTSTSPTGDQKLRATYEYYLHGPLKRIELGDEIQGIDFVYNINGWLTQINHPDPAQDPGEDDNDVFGMILDYYESDMNNLFVTGTQQGSKNSRTTTSFQNSLVSHQPLIRFMPEDNVQKAESFRDFSATNPKYKEMIQQSIKVSTNR